MNMFYWRNLVIVAMETDDNQIDFSSIAPLEVGTPKFSYTLKQQRELVLRDVNLDSIQKFAFIIDAKNVFYGIALRKSGLFDIYWNMTIIDSPQNGKNN